MLEGAATLANYHPPIHTDLGALTGYKGTPINLATALHDGRTGRLQGAPGVHGVGIGFPEVYTDVDGHTEPRVGVGGSFVQHIERVWRRPACSTNPSPTARLAPGGFPGRPFAAARRPDAYLWPQLKARR